MFQIRAVRHRGSLLLLPRSPLFIPRCISSQTPPPESSQTCKDAPQQENKEAHPSGINVPPPAERKLYTHFFKNSEQRLFDNRASISKNLDEMAAKGEVSKTTLKVGQAMDRYLDMGKSQEKRERLFEETRSPFEDHKAAARAYGKLFEAPLSMYAMEMSPLLPQIWVTPYVKKAQLEKKVDLSNACKQFGASIVTFTYCLYAEVSRKEELSERPSNGL